MDHDNPLSADIQRFYKIHNYNLQQSKSQLLKIKIKFF